jgi:peptide/nickel transport system permease protein
MKLPAATPSAQPIAESAGRHRPIARRAFGSRTFVAGLCIVGCITMLAVLAPVISRYGPNQQNPFHTLEGPSAAHWLGTDDLGRDVWSRVLYAGRTDLFIGFAAVLFPLIFGTLLGIMVGYFGGRFDTFTMRLVDVIIAFPFFVLVIALVFIIGPGIRGIFIAIALTDWVVYTRIIRSQTLVVRELDWVAAARAGGLSHARVLRRHILPNTIPQAIVYVMSDIVYVLLAVVTLGYLGLGIQPPTPDWGSMISEGQSFLTTNLWLSTIPGVPIVLIGLGLSLCADGLTDVLRPP